MSDIIWFTPKQIEDERMRRLFAEAAERERLHAEQSESVARESRRKFVGRKRFTKPVNNSPTTFGKKFL